MPVNRTLKEIPVGEVWVFPAGDAARPTLCFHDATLRGNLDDGLYGTGTAIGVALGGTSYLQVSSAAVTVGAAELLFPPDVALSRPAAGVLALSTGSQLQLPNGTAAAPALAANADPDTGFVFVPDDRLDMALGGMSRIRFSTAGMRLGSAMTLGWASTTDPSLTTNDVQVVRDAANVLALKRSTNPQELRVYGTDDGAGNTQRMALRFASAAFRVLSEATGTGTVQGLILGTEGSGSLRLRTNATNRWQVAASAGHLLAEADNAYDIGASGATRPRHVYIAGSYYGDGSQLSGITGATGGISNPGSTTIGSDDDSSGNESIFFQTQTATRWEVSGNGGHLIAGVDNTHDVGASGATRPRSLYVGTSVQIGSSPAQSGGLRLQNGTAGAVVIRNGAGSLDVEAVNLTSGNVLRLGAGTNVPTSILFGAVAASGLTSLTVSGSLVSPSVGPASGQQHTLPAVSSDTIALLAATQTLTAKTLTTPILTGYAEGSLPAASTAGRLARTTDFERGLWIDTGTNWSPLNGRQGNVMSFGAKGDGTTDDTAAIQAAINNCGHIIFPRPSTYYKVTSTITIPAGRRLTGPGRSFAGIQAAPGFTGNAIFQLGTTSDYVTIEHFQFKGGSAAPGNVGRAIEMLAVLGFASFVHIENNDFQYFSGAAIYNDLGNIWYVQGNQFRQIGYAVHSNQGGIGSYIARNRIYECETGGIRYEPGATGALRNPEGVIIRDNDMAPNGVAPTWGIKITEYSLACYLINNMLDGVDATYGIWIGGNAHVVRDNWIAGDPTEGNPDFGIYIHPLSDDIVVAGNRIGGWNQWGMIVAHQVSPPIQPSRIKIEGNYFASNDLDVAGGGDLITQSCLYGIVTGNWFETTTGHNYASHTGVGSGNNVNLTDNRFHHEPTAIAGTTLFRHNWGKADN